MATESCHFLLASEELLEHDDSGSSANVFDGVFSNAIMMMPSHTTVSHGLVVLFKRFTKSLGGAHIIVSAMSLHSDAQRNRLALKFQFRLNRFIGGESDLVLYLQTC